MRTAYRVLEPTWHVIGFRALGPAADLAELLELAPAELVEVELRAAGLDPHATGWPSESAG